MISDMPQSHRSYYNLIKYYFLLMDKFGTVLCEVILCRKEKQTPPKRGLPAKCEVVQRCGTFQRRGAFFIEQGGFENGEVRLYIRYANKPFSKQRSYMENERGFLFVAQEFHIRRTILRHRIDNQFYQPAVMYIEAV